jgi:hypothetical protein
MSISIASISFNIGLRNQSTGCYSSLNTSIPGLSGEQLVTYLCFIYQLDRNKTRILKMLMPSISWAK